MAEINNVIAEASQDLQTIEDFVNLPAGSDVRPRLLPSVNVGTLSGIRDAIFEVGGLPATPFATKALMTASALVDGDYAQVTDDTVNNGLYVKTAGAWVKSDYDPVTTAVSISSQELGSLIAHNKNTEIAHVIITKDGVVLEHTTSSGEKFLFNDTTPLHEQLTTAEGFPYKVINDGEGLAVVTNDGYSLLHIKSDGSFYTANSTKSLQYEQKETKARVHINSIALAQDESARKTIAKALVNANTDPLFTLADVANYGGVAGEIQRIGAILKVSEGVILCFWGGGVAGYDGDDAGVKLYKTFIKYDKYGNVNVEPKQLFRAPPLSSDVSKHPMLGKLQDGRIVLVWDEGRASTGYKQYIAYSSDGGLTFTSPSLIFSNSYALGSCGLILTLSSGRLVMPMYRAPGITFLVYSDDGGLTWLKSNELSHETYHLVEPAVELNAAGEIVVSIPLQKTIGSGFVIAFFNVAGHAV